jgi:sterol desaturase/sphingolipid hydroxylase (fatty acid hydroxylase superfamily)
MKKLQATDNSKGQIFNNSILEVFTKTSPMLTAFYYGGIIASFLCIHFANYHSSWSLTLGVFASALFFWTLFEYGMHRYVFHFMNEKDWSKKLHFAIHGVHHQYPRDVSRLFMPPLPGTIIIGVLTAFFYMILGQFLYIWMSGFLVGWSMYVSIHYVIHVYQPIKPFKYLWTHHAMHHYKNEEAAFGVSSTLWDKVFGTMP